MELKLNKDIGIHMLSNLINHLDFNTTKFSYRIFRTSFNKFYKVILFFLFIVFIHTNVFADVMELKDGSFIQGKILREDENIILFASSSGTFEVKKVNKEKIFITNSYKEDLEIVKIYLPNADPELVKKNYEVGMRKKMLMKKDKGLKKYFEYWDYGRISLSVTYFATFSEEIAGSKTINSRLPAGFSGQFTYEQGLDMLLYPSSKSSKNKDSKGKGVSTRKYVKTKQRPVMMPGLRIEWSYLYFTKNLFIDNDKEISGSLSTMGLMWCFPSPHNVWGCFVLSVMPGISFIRVQNRDTGIRRDGETFALAAVFGYEYAIKQQVALLLHVRYTYIHDQQISFHGIGGSFGVAIRLW